MTMPAIPIVRMGRCVADMLAGVRGVEVGAVFERSFYITRGDAWACLLPLRGGIGPLNALLNASIPSIVMQQLHVGQPVNVSNNMIAVGNFRCTFAHADIWDPTTPEVRDAASLTRGLAALDQLLAARRLSGEGLAPLLNDSGGTDPEHAVAVAARSPIRRWQEALTAAITTGQLDAAAVDELGLLVGLGPGLTPSGDDAIGGTMIALHILGYGALRDMLWSRLRAIAATSTSRISFAHMRAAARGSGHEALHAALHSLLRGDAPKLSEALVAIDAIGHTSGWDALVGCVIVLKAWLGARSPTVPARSSDRPYAAVAH